MKLHLVDPYICPMPKASVSWILLMLMLVSVSAKTILFLDYELRADFYAKNYCVKKDIPDNCCKGSCHLSKELKEQDDREAKSFPSINMKLDIVFIKDEQNKIVSPSPVGELSFIEKDEVTISGEHVELLRPPGC